MLEKLHESDHDIVTFGF